MQPKLCEFWEIPLKGYFYSQRKGGVKWRKVAVSSCGKAGIGEAVVKGEHITHPFYAEDCVRKI